jgi:hypothetical protein
MGEAIVVTVVIVCAVILLIWKYLYNARAGDAPVYV